MKGVSLRGLPPGPQLQSCHSERRRKRHVETDRNAIQRLAEVIRSEGDTATQVVRKSPPRRKVEDVPAFDREALARLAEQARFTAEQEPEEEDVLVADGAGFVPLGAAPGVTPSVAPGAAQGALPIAQFDPPPPPAPPMLEPATVLCAEEVVAAQPASGVETNDTTRKREAAATAAVLAQAAAEAQARAATAPTAALGGINNKKLKGGHNAMGPTRGPSAPLTAEQLLEPAAPATSSGVPGSGRARGPMKMFLLPVGFGARGLAKPATEAVSTSKSLEDAATHSATLGGTPTGGAGQGRPKASMKMFLLPVGLSARGLAKPPRETTPPRPPEEPAPPPPATALESPARRSGTRTPEEPREERDETAVSAEGQGPTKYGRSQSQSARRSSKRRRSRNERSRSKHRTKREERPERAGGRRRRSKSRRW